MSVASRIPLERSSSFGDGSLEMRKLRKMDRFTVRLPRVEHSLLSVSSLERSSSFGDGSLEMRKLRKMDRFTVRLPRVEHSLLSVSSAPWVFHSWPVVLQRNINRLATTGLSTQ